MQPTTSLARFDIHGRLEWLNLAIMQAVMNGDHATRRRLTDERACLRQRLAHTATTQVRA
jgi:hypothetical protein